MDCGDNVFVTKLTGITQNMQMVDAFIINEMEISSNLAMLYFIEIYINALEHEIECFSLIGKVSELKYTLENAKSSDQKLMITPRRVIRTQFDVEAYYILFCIQAVIHFNLPQHLKDDNEFIKYVSIMSSLIPMQYLAVNMKLDEPCIKPLNNSNFVWTTDHLNILECYNNLRKIICIMNARKMMKSKLTGIFKYANITDYKLNVRVQTSRTRSRSFGTNTDSVQEYSMVNLIKSKIPCIFNNSLWKVSLCGDSVNTKTDVSACILRGSCFHDVLNLKPAIEYIKACVDPLNSYSLMKNVLKDLGKTLLYTIIPCPV